MIPILFGEGETTFNNNGIATLFDTIDYNIFEARNGEFEMELHYPVNGKFFSELKDFRMILGKPNDEDEDHAFRIYEIEKVLELNKVIVYATTKSNDLAGNMVNNVVINDENPQQAMTKMKANLIDPTPFNFVSDIDTKSSTSWTRRNPLNCISGQRGSLVSVWGGEIKRTNDTVYLYSRRGRDKVTTIRPGKNLDGFTLTSSTKGLITRIVPIFTYTPEGEQEEVTIVGDIVDSPLRNNYPVSYIREIDMSFTDGVSDLESLNATAQTYFTYMNPGCDKPKVEIDVDLMQLSDSAEYEKFKDFEHIGITDTVIVWVEKFDVDVEVKVTELTYNGMKEQVTKIVAGTSSTSLFTEMEATYNHDIDRLKDYVNTVENGVRNTIQRAADGKKNIFRGYTEPGVDVSMEGDLWYKEMGDGELEVYQFDGAYWQPIITKGMNAEVKKKIEDAEALAQGAEAHAAALEVTANSILAGLGVDTIEETHAQIIADIKAQVNDRIKVTEGFGTTISQIIENPGGTISGYQTVASDASQAVQILEQVKTSPGEHITGYNELVQTAEGNTTTIGNIKTTPETTITGYNTLKTTAEGNTTTIAKIKSTPEGEILGYQEIVDAVDFHSRTIGSSNSEFQNKVTQIIQTSDIIQTEVQSYFGDYPNIFYSDTARDIAGYGLIYLYADESWVINEPYRLVVSTLESTLMDLEMATGTSTSGFAFVKEENGRKYFELMIDKFTFANDEIEFINNDSLPLRSIKVESLTRIDPNSIIGRINDTSTRVTQLADSWALTIKSNDDLVTAINASTDGVYVKGSNITWDGDTTVIGNLTVTDTMFASNMSISKFTTGTLNANNVNIINLNVSRLVGDTTDFVKSAWNSISSRLNIDALGLSISRADGSRNAYLSVNGYEFWMDGDEHGKFSIIKASDTSSSVFYQKYGISLLTENDGYISLSHRGGNTEASNNWEYILRADGGSGRLYFDNIYPSAYSDNGLKLDTLAAGGVRIRHKDANFGVDYLNNNRVHVEGKLSVSDIIPYRTATQSVNFQQGTVSNQAGIWLRDMTGTAGIFFANNGNSYLKTMNGIFSLRTVLQNSGFSQA